jgi:hypothetical protein
MRVEFMGSDGTFCLPLISFSVLSQLDRDADSLSTPILIFFPLLGGLLNLKGFSGLKSLLSGPAGGVVGFALTAYSPSSPDPPPVIGLDIGGTSTDVSRYAGRFETWVNAEADASFSLIDPFLLPRFLRSVYETTTAGITINVPQLDINTVAAGGGSCLTFRNGLFLAGPVSAQWFALLLSTADASDFFLFFPGIRWSPSWTRMLPKRRTSRPHRRELIPGSTRPDLLSQGLRPLRERRSRSLSEREGIQDSRPPNQE